MDEKDIDATYDLAHQAALSGIDKNDDDEWKRHPLFITELPDDIENDKYLGAIQHVMYDGETPDSMAKHFKNLGNDLFQSGKHNWLAAAKWWTQGLKENPTDESLKSILHSNRATVSLGLGQYQKAALDADWAIKYDKFNKKAYLRAAHAYQGMSNWDKAIAAAEAGLEIVEADDPIRAPLQEVITKVNNEIQENRKRVCILFDSIKSVSSFLKQRKISVGQFEHSWQGNWDLLLQYDEDKEETIWPMVIAFDEVLQVDFMEAVTESISFIEILAMVLPGLLPNAQSPPWDIEKRYTTDSVLIYIKTNSVPWVYGRDTPKKGSKYIMVDPEASLKDVFLQKDYVIPGYPIIGIGVKTSVFVEKLGITQIIGKGGVRKDLPPELIPKAVETFEVTKPKKEKVQTGVLPVKKPSVQEESK